MEYCKLQAGCLIIILYIAFLYFRERKHIQAKRKLSRFDGLLALGIVCLGFDGLTAYFVNHQEQISEMGNRILHLFFLVSLDAFIFLLFLYMLLGTGALSGRRGIRLLLWIPFVINVAIVAANIDSLEFRRGEISNYSMGISAYACFVMAGTYLLLAVVTFFRRWNAIEGHKRISIFTYLLVLLVVTGYQSRNPQALVSSIGVTVIILGVYMNQENPVIEKLSSYHSEMIMGFATLVENRDDSTGGHIKRTAIYVQLLAEELKNRGMYKKLLTKDYMNELSMAAPMHDIGKIAVPDAILQKPGKLTDEEYEIMKQHTVSGGKIIQDTFGHMGKSMYGDTAYQVARYHHEKWNGKGYPEGLKRREIPLCARIMAVADVFDAISQNRCYREAMPLDRCFDIIAEGSGQDFDPVLADVFLDIRERVEEVFEEVQAISDQPPQVIMPCNQFLTNHKNRV